MKMTSGFRSLIHNTAITLSFVAAMNFTIGIPLIAAAVPPSNDNNTTTPIKHVIVIIGENRTFDHIFATYQPKAGQTINNLLSEKIVNSDGSPGSNFSMANQNSACDVGRGGLCPNTGATSATGQPYQNNPGNKALYPFLPDPLAGGPTNVCTNNGMCTPRDATTSENGPGAQLLSVPIDRRHRPEVEDSGHQDPERQQSCPGTLPVNLRHIPI
jgi:phospholipase C